MNLHAFISSGPGTANYDSMNGLELPAILHNYFLTVFIFCEGQSVLRFIVAANKRLDWEH